jgi:hypothetical protein
MSQVVEAILHQIENLDESDRRLLEEQLQLRAEAEWLEEANEARAVARAQGIDQRSIDKAIEDVRYGL